jgi:CheY-like chemotaxis protein
MPSDAAPCILFYPRDLFFAVRVQDIVTKLGGRVHILESAAGLEEVTASPALVVVEMGSVGQGDWLDALQRARARWPETPILAFGAHVDVAARQAARAAGSDEVWARSRFVTEFPALAARHLQPQADAAGCEEPLPELARKGLILFNQGAFYRCHDALEAAWVAERRDCRRLYQGILQLAIALHHIQQGNYRGAMKMFGRAEDKFARLPDRCQGIDVARLRRITRELHATLRELGPERMDVFPADRYPTIPLPDPH